MQIGGVFTAADKNFALRHAFDLETGAAQHGFGASAIRNPPICRIVRIALLHKMHFRETGTIEHISLPERVVFNESRHGTAATQHRLKYEPVVCGALTQQVEREQWMAQMIKDAHEDNKIEAFSKIAYFVHGHLFERDVEIEHAGGEARLFEIVRIVINADHFSCAAEFHLNGIESGIASDIENTHAGEVVRHRVLKISPFHRGIVAEEVVGRCFDARQREVMKPWAQFGDPFLDFVHGEDFLAESFQR